MQFQVERAARIAVLWLAAAWLMSLTTLGFFVVPMLFANLPSPALAGAMAGKLFSVQTAISVVCAAALGALLWCCPRAAEKPVFSRLVPLALLGAVLALAVELVVSPHIVARDNLRFWHSLGSTMYLVQWLCALWVFGRLSSSRQNA